MPNAKLWDDFKHKYGQALFDYHLEQAEKRLSQDNINWILEHSKKISNNIEFWQHNGHKEHLYENYDLEEQTVKAIRTAVRSEIDQDEDRYTVGQIDEAIDSYEHDKEWVVNELEQLKTQSIHTLTSELRKLEGKIEIEETKDRLPNRYSFSTGSARLEINEIEDLLQLPCIQNLDEKLRSRSNVCNDDDPLRWELFTLVRLIMWMPPWYDPESGEFDKEKVLKDIKEFFDGRYSWYDEETTEYQVRYEFRQNETSEFASPNCGNKNIDTYCIGQKKCDHTIYGSLPFPEQHFDALPNTKDTGL